MKIFFIVLIIFIALLARSNKILNEMITDLNLEIHGINKKLMHFENHIQSCVDKINKIIHELEK